MSLLSKNHWTLSRLIQQKKIDRLVACDTLDFIFFELITSFFKLLFFSTTVKQKTLLDIYPKGF